MSEVAQTAVVTGGAVRIGRELALALAETGWQVVVHFGQSAEAAAEIKHVAKTFGADLVGITQFDERWLYVNKCHKLRSRCYN